MQTQRKQNTRFSLALNASFKFIERKEEPKKQKKNGSAFSIGQKIYCFVQFKWKNKSCDLLHQRMFVLSFLLTSQASAFNLLICLDWISKIWFPLSGKRIHFHKIDYISLCDLHPHECSWLSVRSKFKILLLQLMYN